MKLIRDESNKEKREQIHARYAVPPPVMVTFDREGEET
jgi:hypothetical protein